MGAEGTTTLGQLLRDARNKKGLSQRQLAHLLEYSIKQVSRWENGTSRPSAQTLQALAKLLDLPLEALQERQDDSVVQNPPEEEGATPALPVAPTAAETDVVVGQPNDFSAGPETEPPDSLASENPQDALKQQNGPGSSRRRVVLLAFVPLILVAVLLSVLLLRDGFGGPEPGSSDNPDMTSPETTSAGPGSGTPPSTPVAPEGAPALLGRDIRPDNEKPCGLQAVAAGGSWTFQETSIDGTPYDAAYRCALLSGASGSLNFTLGKQYDTLDVVVGFADNTVPTPHKVKFEFIQDGRLYLTQPFELLHGETRTLRLSVDRTSKLEIRLTETQRPGGNELPASPVVAGLALN